MRKVKTTGKLSALVLCAAFLTSCFSVTASADAVWEAFPYQGLSEFYNGDEHFEYYDKHVVWEDVTSIGELKSYLEEDRGEVDGYSFMYSENANFVLGLRLKSDLYYECLNGEKAELANDDSSFITLGSGYKILDLNGHTISVTDGSAAQSSCLFNVPEDAEFAICGDEDGIIEYDGKISHQYSQTKIWNYNLQRDIIWNYGKLHISGEPVFNCGHVEDLSNSLDFAYMSNLSLDNESESAYDILSNYAKNGVKAVVNGSAIRSSGSLVITGGTFRGRGITSYTKNGKNYATPNYAVSIFRGNIGNPHFICTNGVFVGFDGADPINVTTNTSRCQIFSGIFKRNNINPTKHIFNGTLYFNNAMLSADDRSAEQTQNIKTAEIGVFPSETFYVNNKISVNDSSETIADYAMRPDFASTVKRSISGRSNANVQEDENKNFINVFRSDETTEDYSVGVMKFGFGNYNSEKLYLDFFYVADSSFTPYAYFPKKITATVYDSTKTNIVLEEEIDHDFDYYGYYPFAPLDSLSNTAKEKLTDFDKGTDSWDSDTMNYYITYSIETTPFMKDAYSNAVTTYKIPLDNAISFTVRKQQR